MERTNNSDKLSTFNQANSPQLVKFLIKNFEDLDYVSDNVRKELAEKNRILKNTIHSCELCLRDDCFRKQNC